MTPINPILSGFKILVCRPEPSASELCRVLESVGAQAQSFPCLGIRTKVLSGEQKALVYDLDQFAKVIVASQHAAQSIIAEVDELWPQMPNEQQWFAIGRKTASVLSQSELSIYEPERDLNSEALLECAELIDVRGEKILIAKGVGGRSKLEQGLRDRGAKVSTLELYERHQIEYSDQDIQTALATSEPDICIALSAETVDALKALAQQAAIDISELCLIVPSKRVALHANRIGFKHTLISEDLRPIDIIKTIARQTHIVKT